MLRNQLGQFVSHAVGLFFEPIELLVCRVVVVLDLDHIVDRLAALVLAVPYQDPIGQRVAGLETSVGQVQRNAAMVVFEWRAKRHDRFADKRILVTCLHTQDHFLHAEIVERSDEDGYGLRPRQDQGLAWSFDDHLRRIVENRHDLRFGHRLVVAVGLVLQLHTVQPVIEQRECPGEVTLTLGRTYRVSRLVRFQFEGLSGRQQFHDGFLGRRHRTGITPDGLAAVQTEHHARYGSTGQSHAAGRNLQCHQPTRLGQVAHSEPRYRARFAFTDQILAPKRPVLPARAVVPLEHDLSRRLVRRQIDRREQHVIGTHQEWLGCPGEAVRMSGVVGWVGVSVPAGERFDGPRAAR